MSHLDLIDCDGSSTCPSTDHVDGCYAESRRERDARTLAGLLGFTVGVEVTPDEADEWLQGGPDDSD